MHENPNPVELIKNWRKYLDKEKQEDKGMYSMASLVGPFYEIVAMFCRLYVYLNTQKFSKEWVPLIEAIYDGYSLDSATILSNNLGTKIRNYRKKCNVVERIAPPFFMSAYIMDAIFFSHDFPSVGWKWIVQHTTPIHVYFDILWESKYHSNFYKICHEAMLPIHQEVFSSKALRLNVEANRDVRPLGKWFWEENFTDIWFFDSLAHPHVLPLFFPDNLLAKEISSQTVGHGLTKVLKDAKKIIRPRFPILYGTYTLENFKHSLLEIDQLKVFFFSSATKLVVWP